MTQQGPNEHVWVAEIRLLSNRDMMLSLAKVIGLAVIIPGCLLSLVFATQGEWKSIPSIWLVFSAVGAGLAVLSLVVMIVFLRNRTSVRYTVSDSGIVFESIDKTIATANRLALVLGMLTGRFSASGVGLIGMSRETQRMRWSGAFDARFDDSRRTITLANRWRRLMVIQCLPDNYAAISGFIRTRMTRHRTAARVPRRSPLPRYLGWTAAVVAACVPLFLLAGPFQVSLLLPILMLCFALATLWLIPLFGYVVLGVEVLVIGAVVLDALRQEASYFRPGVRYVRWTIYSGDDWALLALAGCCLAFLGWFAVRAVRGRLPSLLMADMTDAGA